MGARHTPAFRHVNKLIGAALLACAALLAAVPLPAHHGTAIYDSHNSIRLKGTVTKFEFVNPHILIHIDAPDQSGAMRHWVIEMSPPSLARRAGWTKDMMKAGDKIEYDVEPVKKGGFAGRGGNKVTINGRVLGIPAPPLL